MRWPWQRKALNMDAGVLEVLASRRGQFFTGLGGSNDAMRAISAAFSVAQSANYAWMYTNSPAIRSVVDLLARNIAQLDLRLYEEVRSDDEYDAAYERIPAYEHPAAMALRTPAPNLTRDQFVRNIMTDFLVFDNAYAVKFRPQPGKLVLQPVPAQRVEILGQSLFNAEAYRITRKDGSQVTIPDPNDVVHWRGYNPHDPRLGYSRLETLRNTVAEEAALLQTIIELLKSGLAGPSWVYRPLEAPEWSNLARERFEQDLANRFKKASTAPPVFEEGMELRDVGVSPKDAEMLEVRKWVLQQVATEYGVPLGMLGLSENVAEAQNEFYADTLPPYCEAFTRQLDLSVLQEEYNETEYCFEFNLDEKHMGESALKSLVSATGRPVMLTNEARARLNLPPVEGGDELVTPSNVTVGEKPSTDVMPIQDPNAPAQDGSARGDGTGVNPTPVGSAAAEEPLLVKQVRELLERQYQRQARSYRGQGKFAGERFTRELTNDLLLLAPQAQRQTVSTMVAGLHDGLEQALQTGEPERVFAKAQRNAPVLAAMLVGGLALDMDQLRELKVPREVLWQRAGFRPDEVDNMRALQLAESLNGGEPG